jgi:hypothetical protein
MSQQVNEDMHRTEVDRESARPSRRLLVGAAAVALLSIGTFVVYQSRDDGVTGQPPVEVATSFIEAYGDFDAERAITYLADDPDISQMITSVGARRVEGTLEEFRLLVSLLEAQGYKQTLISCEELRSTASGAVVHCTSDYHNLRSDEIGRGPFSAVSFYLTVRDREIVEARKEFGVEEFSPQMWEPFASWVSKAYPEDAALMYEDETHSGVRLTEESVRLWERHTRGYVEEVGRNT